MRSTGEVVQLAEDAERPERELKEAMEAEAAQKVEAVQVAARRDQAQLQKELADLRSRMEEEQRQRSAFEQKASRLQTDKERLQKIRIDREAELESKCSWPLCIFLLSSGLRIRSRGRGE